MARTISVAMIVRDESEHLATDARAENDPTKRVQPDRGAKRGVSYKEEQTSDAEDESVRTTVVRTSPPKLLSSYYLQLLTLMLVLFNLVTAVSSSTLSPQTVTCTKGGALVYNHRNSNTLEICATNYCFLVHNPLEKISA